MSFAEVLAAREERDRPPPPPPVPPTPEEGLRTFGDFLANVRSTEAAVGETRAIADSMNGEPGTAYYRIQAGVWEADAAYKKHPAFPRLEAHVNRLYGRFTQEHLLRVRGEVCGTRRCGTTEVDALPVEAVVAALDGPATPAGEIAVAADPARRVDTRPASVEPPPQFVEAAMRALPGALNNAPMPRGVPAPAGRRGTDYASLRQALEAQAHGRDAAEWAIHRHIEAGRLEACPGMVSTPGVHGGGGWMVQPVRSHTYERERCVLWATLALRDWWYATQIPADPPARRAESTGLPDLPSPFTVPEPNWTLGESSIPPLENLPQVWTLGALLQQLRAFAGRDANQHELVEPPGGGVVFTGGLARAAIVLAYRRALTSAPRFDELQTQLLLRYESAITVAAVNRLIRDILTTGGRLSTISQAEQLEVGEALDLLRQPAQVPKEATKKRVKKVGRPPVDPVFDNRVWEAWNTGRYPDYAALAQELNCRAKEIGRAIDRMRKKRPA